MAEEFKSFLDELACGLRKPAVPAPGRSALEVVPAKKRWDRKHARVERALKGSPVEKPVRMLKAETRVELKVRGYHTRSARNGRLVVRAMLAAAAGDGRVRIWHRILRPDGSWRKSFGYVVASLAEYLEPRGGSGNSRVFHLTYEGWRMVRLLM